MFLSQRSVAVGGVSCEELDEEMLNLSVTTVI